MLPFGNVCALVQSYEGRYFYMVILKSVKITLNYRFE